MLNLELPEPFAVVWPDLREFFERTGNHFQAIADGPTIRLINAHGASRLGHYDATLEIMRDVSIQAYADLEMALMCQHPDLLLGTGRTVPEGEDVPYTVRFAVSVAGPEVAALDVETLPPLPQAAEHEAALRDYVDRAQHLVRDSMKSIEAAFLAAISEPPQE